MSLPYPSQELFDAMTFVLCKSWAVLCSGTVKITEKKGEKLQYCSIFQILHMHTCTKLLHVAFIVMLARRAVVLVSFFPVHTSQMLASYETRLRATLVEKKAPASSFC